MADEAEAAAAMAGMAAGSAPAKKRSRTKVEVLEDKLAAAEQKSMKLNADVTALEVVHRSRGRKMSDAQAEKSQKTIDAKQVAATLQADVVKSTREQLVLARKAAEVKATEKVAKHNAAAANAENTKAMSEQGIKELVTIRCSLQHKMDNKSDKNEAV